MEEGFTSVEFIALWKKEKGSYVQLKKQKLACGKKIPSGARIWIWSTDIGRIDDVLKKIRVNNFAINTWVFDT
jgi:hypothetical protein